MLEHTWEDASCTTPQICTVCKEKQGDTLPHEYLGELTQKPSCDSVGHETFTCIHCGEYYVENVAATVYTATEISAMFEGVVGKVITYYYGDAQALGTCVVYSSDGTLITNYHVIEDATSATVEIAGKTYEVQSVLAYDKYIDLAVLKIDASGLNAATFCQKDHATGGTVYAIGHSLGMEYTLSRGIITYSNREVDGVVYTQHDAAISSGNSGGPLINELGEVIGINTWTFTESQNLNFAISMSEMDNLDFSNPLTMQELFDKECNPYLRLATYIITNGTYRTSSSGSDYYILNMGTYYSSDAKFTRYAYYYLDDGSITFDLAVDDGDYYIYFTIDGEVDGIYAWSYFDDYDYKMSGTLYANTYNDDTLLGYSYNNISNSDLRDSVRNLASTMMDLLATFLNSDLSDIGITAADLGFWYY